MKERACRVCGCTQSRACPSRCWWIEEDLCSSCEGRLVAELGDQGEALVPTELHGTTPLSDAEVVAVQKNGRLKVRVEHWDGRKRTHVIERRDFEVLRKAQ